MWTSKTVIASAFLAIISLTESAFIKKENSLIPPYSAEAETMMFWDLTGSAQTAGAFIRLTADEDFKQGGIWNKLAMFANNWEFHSHFRIHGKGVNLYGDGMAFWYVRDKLHHGPVFGSKDYFSGLGVFVDTFGNNQDDSQEHHHPYISAMVNNGSLHYDHDEDGTWTQIGGCHAPMRNMDVPTRIAISYINDVLAVYLDFEGLGNWKICFRSVGVHLPTGYSFGITASTSEVSDNHDIIAATALVMDEESHQWQDRSRVIPEAENVFIPERYHKDKVEEEEHKVDRQREVKEEDSEEVEEEEEIEAEKIVEAEKIAEAEKEARAQRGARVERETRDERKAKAEKQAETEKGAKTSETTSEEVTPPSISLFRKLIYVIGTVIIIYLAISTYRKYSERKRERMQKRLF